MFDLEVLVPMSSKNPSRAKDFKRYGLINVQNRRVLVNVLVSGENLDDAELDWPKGVEVVVIHDKSPDYVSNTYKFYAGLNPTSPNARWLMRVDDDSCTDVDGLVKNLDAVYDWEFPFHLGSLAPFNNAKKHKERVPFEKYKSLLGCLQDVCGELYNEVECGIMSAAAVSKVFSNPRARDLVEKRSKIDGGYSDCVVALASAIAKVFPTSCPFVTHLPLIERFSLFGGIKNHIHMVSRVDKSENFRDGRCSYEGFILLTKAIEASPSNNELALIGKKIQFQEDNKINNLKLKSDYFAEVEKDQGSFYWYEEKDEVVVLKGINVAYRFPLKDTIFLDNDGVTVPIF